MRDMLCYMRANPIAMTLISLVLGILLARFGTAASSTLMFMAAGGFIIYISARRGQPRR
jgi:lipopolysaccharide export LptBFGC system permease protein LptF